MKLWTGLVVRFLTRERLQVTQKSFKAWNQKQFNTCTGCAVPRFMLCAMNWCKDSVFLDNNSFVNGKMFCKCFNFPVTPLVREYRLPTFALFFKY